MSVLNEVPDMSTSARTPLVACAEISESFASVSQVFEYDRWYAWNAAQRDLASASIEQGFASASALRTAVVVIVKAHDRRGDAILREAHRLASKTSSAWVPVRIDSEAGAAHIGPFWRKDAAAACPFCFYQPSRDQNAAQPRVSKAPWMLRTDTQQIVSACTPSNSCENATGELLATALDRVRSIIQIDNRSGRTPWGRAVWTDGGPSPAWQHARIPRQLDCSYCSPERPVEGAGAEPLLSTLFHEHTKLRPHFGFADAIRNPDATPRWAMQDRFCASTLESVSLPSEHTPTAHAFEHLVRARRSHRKYRGVSITLAELAYVLQLANGVSKHARIREGLQTYPLRTAASGGALYPVELYVHARAVQGVATGTYYFDPCGNRLVRLPQQKPLAQLQRASAYGEMIGRAAATVVLSARFANAQSKYGERGYRLVLCEAGHIGQNLQLAATARGLRSCCVMGFADDEYSDFLGLDGHTEAAIYSALIGR